jgi:hypothetical protein
MFMYKKGLIGFMKNSDQLMAKQVQFRAQVPPYVDFVVRAIAPLKNSGQDWSLGDIAHEALTDWLKKPENQALIKKHNLLEALADKGIEVPQNWLDVD